jgi:hypothetical protein
MKRLLDYVWPVVGLIAVVWSVELLYSKLFAEAATDPQVAKILESGGLWSDITTIASGIGRKLAGIPAHSYLLAALSTLGAYWALAWYDRIALLHLNRAKGISWTYVACCSFVTYALSHNIGASVFSGGMVRLRAYTAKGLRRRRSRCWWRCARSHSLSARSCCWASCWCTSRIFSRRWPSCRTGSPSARRRRG